MMSLWNTSLAANVTKPALVTKLYLYVKFQGHISSNVALSVIRNEFAPTHVRVCNYSCTHGHRYSLVLYAQLNMVKRTQFTRGEKTDSLTIHIHSHSPFPTLLLLPLCSPLPLPLSFSLSK